MVLALLLGGACRVETTVGVRMGADGSGAIVVDVVLDDDAVARIGDLRAEVRTADLEQAGWIVEGPTPVDGWQRLRLSHSFADAEEGERLFRSLATDDGPFGDVHLDQKRGFWSTETTFRATIDLQGGLEAFGDPALTEALGGQPLGVPVDDLQQRLGTALDRLFTLRVAARLPGSVESNAPSSVDGGALWRPRLGEKVTLEASSTTLNRPRVALVGLAAVSAIASLAVLTTWARGRRLGRPSPVGPGDPSTEELESYGQ